MKVAVIIPSRMAATRFPCKPLAKIAGLTMIEHVYRRCAIAVGSESVWIATCDIEIRQEAAKFGAKSIMTSDTHVRCTDRVAEAASELDCDVVVNVQGDEPVLDPNAISAAIEPFKEDPNCLATNLIQRIDAQVENPASYNLVKVVFNIKKEALYFSRALIPSNPRSERGSNYYKQIGLMAFRKDFLKKFSALLPTTLEYHESVDMMRMVEHGYALKLVESSSRFLSVDVPEDIPAVEAALANDKYFREYGSRSNR